MPSPFGKAFAEWFRPNSAFTKWLLGDYVKVERKKGAPGRQEKTDPGSDL